jgi:hypothetical protein
MTRPYIEIFLPVFILAFLFLFLIWNYKWKRGIQGLYEKRNYLKDIIQVNLFFHVLLAIAVLIIGLYAFIPEYYQFLLPIDELDIPLVNDIGLFILRIAFFWLLSSIIYTIILFRKIEKEKVKKPVEVYVYAQKIVLVSGAIMLIGLFITISSVAAFLLSLVGFICYQRFYKAIAAK